MSSRCMLSKCSIGYVDSLMYTASPNAPTDWADYTHPEGSLYFRNRERVSIFRAIQYIRVQLTTTQRIWTGAYLCDRNKLWNITSAIDQIDQLIAQEGANENNFDELVLELMPGPGNICGYYYVDHANRSFRWLHDHNITCYISGVIGAESPAHISMAHRDSAFCTLMMTP